MAFSEAKKVQMSLRRDEISDKEIKNAIKQVFLTAEKGERTRAAVADLLNEQKGWTNVVDGKYVQRRLDANPRVRPVPFDGGIDGRTGRSKGLAEDDVEDFNDFLATVD